MPESSGPATFGPVGRDAALRAPAPSRGRFVRGRFADAHGTRHYKLYLPPCGTLAGRPLLLMLHGCGQDVDDFAAGTRMNEAAREHGVVVLYPRQCDAANRSGAWNWFDPAHQQRGRGEPAILAGMAAAIVRRHRLDARRVHVAGLSAGGAMAAILGASYPDVFAAVGVHSGLPVGAASDVFSGFLAMMSGPRRRVATPARPPTIVFHGDGDGTVHPSNGAVLAAPDPGDPAPVPETLRFDGAACTRTIGRDRDGRVKCEHWLVHGGGHAWFGGRADAGFTEPRGPSATVEMLRFFAGCVRPVAS